MIFGGLRFFLFIWTSSVAKYCIGGGGSKNVGSFTYGGSRGLLLSSSDGWSFDDVFWSFSLVSSVELCWFVLLELVFSSMWSLLVLDSFLELEPVDRVKILSTTVSLRLSKAWSKLFVVSSDVKLLFLLSSFFSTTLVATVSSVVKLLFLTSFDFSWVTLLFSTVLVLVGSVTFTLNSSFLTSLTEFSSFTSSTIQITCCVFIGTSSFSSVFDDFLSKSTFVTTSLVTSTFGNDNFLSPWFPSGSVKIEIQYFTVSSCSASSSSCFPSVNVSISNFGVFGRSLNFVSVNCFENDEKW